ncbi:hypothetical protein GCM10010448_66240 [Streptomyces glomeratus]|uniref:Uncharacterized protein n=1 Tax=Streptomyces glomeratus TaxID=284452 RepID=A0ABP6M7G2_9ACTN
MAATATQAAEPAGHTADRMPGNPVTASPVLVVLHRSRSNQFHGAPLGYCRA